MKGQIDFNWLLCKQICKYVRKKSVSRPLYYGQRTSEEMDGILKIDHDHVGLKIIYIFTETQCFLFKFMKRLSYVFQSWGHDPNWYLSCPCKNYALFQKAKIFNLTKMPMFELLKNQVSVNPEILIPHWYELFNHFSGPITTYSTYHPTLAWGVILGPPYGSFNFLQFYGALRPFLKKPLYSPT